MEKELNMYVRIYVCIQARTKDFSIMEGGG